MPASAVDDKVAIVISDVDYDVKTEAISFDATLTNRSTTPLAAPIGLSVNCLTSFWGTLSAENASNAERHQGARWDFLIDRASGVLETGESTAVKRLTFSLSNRRSFDGREFLSPRGSPLMLLNIDISAFATTP
jgi:hypothetical protein